MFLHVEIGFTKTVINLDNVTRFVSRPTLSRDNQTPDDSRWEVGVYFREDNKSTNGHLEWAGSYEVICNGSRSVCESIVDNLIERLDVCHLEDFYSS